MTGHVLAQHIRGVRGAASHPVSVSSAQHSASPDEVAGTVCPLNYRLTSMCPGNS